MQAFNSQAQSIENVKASQKELGKGEQKVVIEEGPIEEAKDESI